MGGFFCTFLQGLAWVCMLWHGFCMGFAQVLHSFAQVLHGVFCTSLHGLACFDTVFAWLSTGFAWVLHSFGTASHSFCTVLHRFPTGFYTPFTALHGSAPVWPRLCTPFTVFAQFLHGFFAPPHTPHAARPRLWRAKGVVGVVKADRRGFAEAWSRCGRVGGGASGGGRGRIKAAAAAGPGSRGGAMNGRNGWCAVLDVRPHGESPVRPDPPVPRDPPGSPRVVPTPPPSPLPPPVLLPGGGPRDLGSGSGTEPPRTPRITPRYRSPSPPAARGTGGGLGDPAAPLAPGGSGGPVPGISAVLVRGGTAGVWGQQSSHRNSPVSGSRRAYSGSGTRSRAVVKPTPKNVTFGVTPRWRERRGRFGAFPRPGSIGLWRFSPSLSLGFPRRHQRPGHRRGDKRRVGLAAPQSQPCATTTFPRRGGETGGDSALRSAFDGRRDPPKAAAKAEAPRRRSVAGACPAPRPELSQVTQL